VLVVRGEDGLDEISTAAPTRVWVARDGAVRETVLDTVDLGLPRSEPGDLRGGDATFNGGAARRVLAGAKGPVRDATLVNAAAALVAHAGGADDLLPALAAALETVATAVDSGAAAALLDRWVTVAQAARADGL
jgi:anthranilate phosphoribosyltransferase